MKKTSLPLKAAAAASLLLLAALLVPMLAIAQYDAPINDDYSYGQDTARAWNASHDVSAVLHAAVRTVRTVYADWQGSYSAVFLMSLEPGIFGIRSYSWTFAVMAGFLLLGLFCIVRTVCGRMLGLPVSMQLLLFALLSILCTQFLPDPLQGLYWFNGSCYYCLCFSFALIFLSLLFSFLRREKGKRSNAVYYIVLPVLAFLLAVEHPDNLAVRTGAGQVLHYVQLEIFGRHARLAILVGHHVRNPFVNLGVFLPYALHGSFLRLGGYDKCRT